MKTDGYIIEKYNHMTNAYTCNRLAAEGQALGMDVMISGIHDTFVTADGVYNCGDLLRRRSFVINRCKWGRLRECVNALAERSYNSPEACTLYVNKYEQVKRLHSGSFRIPRYVLATPLIPLETLERLTGLPAVAKGTESSMGEEVFLIRERSDLQMLCSRFGIAREWLFEEFIAASSGRDLRLFSMRGEAVACMQRKSRGDFRANVALGAEVEPYDVTEVLRTAARDLYEETGLDCAGIDLLFGEDGYVFCEINVMPGIEGIEKATGINIAGAVMEMIRRDF